MSVVALSDKLIDYMKNFGYHASLVKSFKKTSSMTTQLFSSYYKIKLKRSQTRMNIMDPI